MPLLLLCVLRARDSEVEGWGVRERDRKRESEREREPATKATPMLTCGLAVNYTLYLQLH